LKRSCVKTPQGFCDEELGGTGRAGVHVAFPFTVKGHQRRSLKMIRHKENKWRARIVHGRGGAWASRPAGDDNHGI